MIWVLRRHRTIGFRFELNHLFGRVIIKNGLFLDFSGPARVEGQAGRRHVCAPQEGREERRGLGERVHPDVGSSVLHSPEGQ